MHNITRWPSNRELKWSCLPVDEGIIIQGTCWAIEHRLDTGLNCLYSTVETIRPPPHNHNGKTTAELLTPPSHSSSQNDSVRHSFLSFLFFLFRMALLGWELVGGLILSTHTRPRYIHWFVSRKYNTVAAGSRERERNTTAQSVGAVCEIAIIYQSL
jgi:hypothetical protein